MLFGKYWWKKSKKVIRVADDYEGERDKGQQNKNYTIASRKILEIPKGLKIIILSGLSYTL